MKLRESATGTYNYYSGKEGMKQFSLNGRAAQQLLKQQNLCIGRLPVQFLQKVSNWLTISTYSWMQACPGESYDSMHMPILSSIKVTGRINEGVEANSSDWSLFAIATAMAMHVPWTESITVQVYTDKHTRVHVESSEGSLFHSLKQGHISRDSLSGDTVQTCCRL